MRNEQTEKITEELKSEVLTYWRDTVKDKDAIARTADLFGLMEEDVKRIIAVRWKEKFVWNEENIFRLKAYMAQGMKMTEISKQLGCKPQAIYDFRRRNKDAFCGFEEDMLCELEQAEEVTAGTKKKEPLTLGDVKDSKKKSDVEVDSSVNDYNTDSDVCQEVGDKASEAGVSTGADNAGCDDEITVGMYNDLYTRFLELWNKNEDTGAVLEDALLILKTAKYAGVQWCERHDAFGNELSDCCRMYDMMVSQALEVLSKALDILENGNDR